MMVLQVTDLVKEYEGTPLFSGVTFHIAAGDRVGLVGPNGAGKSTLMRIIAGELSFESGQLSWVTPGLSRAYLSQERTFDPDRPLGEQLDNVDSKLLGRCGITRNMLRQPVATLSGGQKTRASLALTLAGQPDLLLLDEPTNHLDTEGLQWLERVLTSYRGTVLVVSHDRYFLDQVTTRTIELREGKAREYTGNYQAFLQQKQHERDHAWSEYRTNSRKKEQLEDAARRVRQWAIQAGAHTSQGAAHMSVAKSMEKRIDRLQVEKPREAVQVNLKLEGAGSGARDQVEARDLGFSYDGSRWLFRHGNFYVQRGDRVAITGPNGTGKSTLVRLLLGELTPTEGRIRCSPVQVAYLAQQMENLNPELTVLEEASGGNSAADQADVRTMLACLLFSRETVYKQVKLLSGGEKVRLALAKILLGAPDILVLDEPTNGLDLPSRERVEEALDQFGGTLLFVSHDRYLLRRLANRVIHLEGGRLEPFSGTYEGFLARRAAPAPAASDDADRKLLLENRLAQLSAALAAPKPEEAERLNAEFIQISRELRALRNK